jgi:hypothetical protein
MAAKNIRGGGKPMYDLAKLGPLLTAEDFQPYVGKIFLVDAQPQPLELRLEKILRRSRDEVVARQPFMLIFTSAWTALLMAAHYRMQPEGGEPVEMYINPTQTAPGERRFYHAVFN